MRRALTPELDTGLRRHRADLIDLSFGQDRLGGSALAQVYERFGSDTPDLDNPSQLAGFFEAIQLLNERGKLLAYHDRSDGGLFVTLCEMAFASHTGLDITLDVAGDRVLGALFSEELGR